MIRTARRVLFRNTKAWDAILTICRKVSANAQTKSVLRLISPQFGLRMNALSRAGSVFLVILLACRLSIAQTNEELAKARLFYETYDVDGDALLSLSEFTEGFIDQSLKERRRQTQFALLLFGKERVENCLGFGFELADSDGNGLMKFEELRYAYDQSAFDDLGDLC